MGQLHLSKMGKKLLQHGSFRSVESLEQETQSGCLYPSMKRICLIFNIRTGI